MARSLFGVLALIAMSAAADELRHHGARLRARHDEDLDLAVSSGLPVSGSVTTAGFQDASMNIAAWSWAITSASSASFSPSPPREVAATQSFSRCRPALARGESSAPVQVPSAAWVAISPPASQTNETPSYQYWLGKYRPENGRRRRAR